MFRRKNAQQEVVPALPKCPGDLSLEQVQATHRHLAQTITAMASADDVLAVLDQVPMTPRNVLQLTIALGQQIARMLELMGASKDYLALPQPAEPVEKAGRMLLAEFIQGDTDTALIIARTLAEPLAGQPEGLAPQIGRAVVVHLTSMLFQYMRA